MSSILEDYLHRHSASLRLYEEARACFPDGVTHDARFVEPFPLFMDRGEGARKWDVDGNEYICYVMGHGALLLGHSHPAIVEEVSTQIRKGTHLGFNTTLELRWARAIQALMPSIERVRFHSSGTEAVMMAIRLARAYTGKSRILKFAHHFHGWSDAMTVEGGAHSGAGIPESTARSVLVAPAPEIGIVERMLEQDRDVAAVILEPTGARMGALPILPEFLRDLRELTRRHGVVLIFDEVVTGFRVSSGGAQERFGVRPDLTTLAKVVAGGLPGGAVGGRADILDMLTHHGPEQDRGRRVSHPGTFNANPLSAAAGARCLEMLAREPINRQVEEAARELKRGINEVIRRRGLPAFAYGYGGLVALAFGLAYEGDLEICRAPHEALLASIGSEATRVFRRGMLNNGVDVLGGYQFILSAAHGPRAIARTVEAVERTLAQMQADGAL